MANIIDSLTIPTGSMALLRLHLEYGDRCVDSESGVPLGLWRPSLFQETPRFCRYISAKSSVSHHCFTLQLVVINISFFVRVIGVTIGQLSLIHHAATSNDPTYDICDISVIEEVVQCLSIVTACWGQLKPFLTWLKSDGRLKVPTYGDGTTFKLQDSKSHSQSRSRKANPEDDYGRSSSRGAPLVVSVTRDWEVESQSSQTHIIQENQHPWMGEGSEPMIKGGRESSDLRR